MGGMEEKMPATATKTLTQLIPVGFKLPAGTRSNAKNLVTPGSVIDQSADPWSLCKDPWTNFPPPDKVAQFNDLLRKRYGQPKPPDPLPHYGQTALHLPDFQAALEMIAAKDPGWFKLKGFGPGPAGPNAYPTQLESHDAQHAFNICKTVIAKAKELGLGV
jgi:hypothetical protein